MVEPPISANQDSSQVRVVVRTPPPEDLIDVITSIIRVEPLDKLFERIISVISKNFGINCITMGALDDDTGFFCVKAVAGYPLDTIKRIKQIAYTMDRMKTDLQDKYRIGRNIYYVKVEDRALAYDDDFLYISDTDAVDIPRATPDAWHVLDYIDFVMTDRDGKWIGWLEINDPGDGKVPSKDILDRIQILTDLAAVAIENSKSFEKTVSSRDEAQAYLDIITHELNNMVRPVEHLARELKNIKGLDQRALEIANNMIGGTRSIRNLIDTIKRYSDAKNARPLTSRDYDLRDILRQAAEVATREFPHRNISINIQRPPHEFLVTADEMILDLFLNVFLSSIRRSQGAVVYVDTKLAESRDLYSVTILDRGTKIPAELLQRILIDESLSTSQMKFTEIGLSMIGLLTRRYNGIVTIRDREPSDRYNGMSFEILLPKASEDAAGGRDALSVGSR